MQGQLPSSEFFSANLIGNSSISNVLQSDIQCSINERFKIPISGESGSYTIAIDSSDLGMFYLNNETTGSTEVNATSEDDIWFVGNTEGRIGTANILITDRETDVQETIPLRVGFPCVQSTRFCKSIDNGACVPYTGNDTTVVQGKSFNVSFLEMILYGGVKTIEALPLPNVEIRDQMNPLPSSFPGSSDSIIGGGIKFAELMNANSYSSLGSKFSQNLNYTVSGVNCAYEENDIFVNSRAIILPENISNSNLPQPAWTAHNFTLNQTFFVDGYTLDNTRYSFAFQPAATPVDAPVEAFEELVNDTLAKSYAIYYEGETIRDQIDSIIRVFYTLPLSSPIFQVIYGNNDTIRFTTQELGLSNINTTGNFWQIGLSSSSMSPFGSSAQIGNISGFEQMNEYLEAFPDTMVEGDILMAYYPGGEGHALWAASNSALEGGNVIQLEPLQGALTSEGLAGPDSREASDKCIVTIQGEQYDFTGSSYTSTGCGADITEDILNSYGQDFIDEILIEYKINQSVLDAESEEQFLSGYDYFFAVVKAENPGVATLHVNGLNCSKSKRITVVPDEVEILVQQEGQVNPVAVNEGKIVLSVNNLATLGARYKNSLIPIEDSAITWVIVDDINRNVVELLDVTSGQNEDGSYIFEDIHTIKALQRGTAVLRAKIDKGAGNFTYSRAITITVEQGLEINGKGYDHTVEVFPGQTEKVFVASGLTDENGQISFDGFKWITDDITHGSFVRTGTFGEQLVYTPPIDDGSARLYIDNLRAINTKTNQAVNISIHITPAEIVNQYITTTDHEQPIVNQELTEVQENQFEFPWLKTAQFVSLPNEGESISIGSCVLGFREYFVTLSVNAAFNNPTNTATVIVSGTDQNIIFNVTPFNNGAGTTIPVTVQNLVDIINGNTVVGIDTVDVGGLLASFSASGGTANNLTSNSNASLRFNTVNGNQIEADFINTGFSIIRNTGNDTNCSDNTAQLVIRQTTSDLHQDLLNLSIPGFGIASTPAGISISASTDWNLTNNTNGDLIVNSFTGQMAQSQMMHFTPDTTNILVEEEVILTVNGHSISTSSLSSIDSDDRRTEIIRDLNTAKNSLTIGSAARTEFDKVVFSAIDASGNIINSGAFNGTANLHTLVLTAASAGTPFTAVVSSVDIKDNIEIRLGRSANLKIVALREDGTVAEWFTSPGHFNPMIFGNPTWDNGTAEGALNIQEGLLTALQVGDYAISVAAPTRWYELAENVAQVTTTGSTAWEEKVRNNPSVTVSIKVLPAFKVNGQFKQTFGDQENKLFITAKTGDQRSFSVTEADPNATIEWITLQNRSGLTENISGTTFNYTAGVKNDETGNAVVDILQVSDGTVRYDVEIVVNPPVIETLELRRLDPDNNPATALPAIHVGEQIPLSLIYQFSGGTTQQVDMNEGGSIPGSLAALNWESSDSAIVTFSAGQALALAEGTATLTVSSSVDSDVKTSLIVTVEGRQASFVTGSTRITPAFPAVDALIHIETIVYMKEGIDKIQDVSIRFNSPYLADAKLKLDESYWGDIQNGYGIAPTETNSETAETIEENAVLDDTNNTSNERRQARYMLDYQLPGETALEGRSITYVLTATTNKGIRTDTNSVTSISSPTGAINDGVNEENAISQMGVITIGSVQGICTPDKKLLCLIRGLKCLKEKQSAVISEECDQVISVFTNEAATFSILDVFKKYKELKK